MFRIASRKKLLSTVLPLLLLISSSLLLHHHLLPASGLLPHGALTSPSVFPTTLSFSKLYQLSRAWVTYDLGEGKWGRRVEEQTAG